MNLFADILLFPFMQRALIGGVIIATLLASLGVLATLRKMAFFSEGIAHASLAGIAIAVLAGASPLPIAILWAVAVAVCIYYVERNAKVSSDVAIGILFTASMALGVLLMSLTAGYQPELVSFLFGSILRITWDDIALMAALSVLILSWYGLSLKQLTLIALSEETAKVAGINTGLQTLLFYIALAIATVLGVKILGIILVSALLILPSAISKLHAQSFKQYVLFSIIVAQIIVLLGLLLSFYYDLPSGAIIVLTGAAFFVISAIPKLFFPNLK